MDDILLTLGWQPGTTAQPLPGPSSHAQPQQWCSDGALCRMHIKISTIPSIIKYWSYCKSIKCFVLWIILYYEVSFIILTKTVLKVICNGFSQNWWKKVVSSCLLQYKPVCVINFDKLCRKMLKKNNFSGLFSIDILRKSSSCVTSYQDALVSFAFY